MDSSIKTELQKFKDDIIIMSRREVARRLFDLPKSTARDKLIKELET